MKFALIILVPLILLGCSGETDQRLPTAPLPPDQPLQLASLLVVVIEEGTGECVLGATVEIVYGDSQSLKQNAPCSVWDPDYDFFFRGLDPYAALTLRASASGYAAKEVIVEPQFGPQPLVIKLSRIP